MTDPSKYLAEKKTLDHCTFILKPVLETKTSVGNYFMFSSCTGFRGRGGGVPMRSPRGGVGRGRGQRGMMRGGRGRG